MTRARATSSTASATAIAGAVLAVASVVVTSLVLSGCSGSDGPVSFRNDGTLDVVVSSGDEDFSLAAGDVSELQDDCTDEDVAVSFPGGATVTVPGPVCADRAVVVHDGTAELVAVTG